MMFQAMIWRYSYFSVELFLLLGNNCFAQSDSIWNQKPEFHFSVFMDVFYAYDFNKPQTDERQPFLYNHNRHNEFNLNLGFIKAGVEHAKYRANLALQAGTYANDNYATEPGLLRNIYEANIGLSLSKKNKLWLSGGIFASHIGFESAVSIDNLTLTRSLLAENSPYYLSGGRLTFQPNHKWELTALICNGWQRIKRVSGNSLPSFGTQVKLTPTEKVIVNWSTFIGTDDPDSTRRMRYFNNFYGQLQFTKKCRLVAGFDIGLQQQAKSSAHYNIWFSPVMIAQYAFTNKWAVALRAEYYQDETSVIIPTETANGFKTAGLSLNLDYSPINFLFCRIEGRWLRSKDEIFQKERIPTNNDIFIVASLAIQIQK